MFRLAKKKERPLPAALGTMSGRPRGCPKTPWRSTGSSSMQESRRRLARRKVGARAPRTWFPCWCSG